MTIGTCVWDIQCKSKWFYLCSLAIVIFYQCSCSAHWRWSQKRPKYL